MERNKERERERRNQRERETKQSVVKATGREKKREKYTTKTEGRKSEGDGIERPSGRRERRSWRARGSEEMRNWVRLSRKGGQT